MKKYNIFESQIPSKFKKCWEKNRSQNKLFLDVDFDRFLLHFGSQVGFIKSGFFEVFPKLAPEGSQEASKRLRKAPKRPPRPDFKRFLLSFWTVFGIVFGQDVESYALFPSRTPTV